MKKILFVAIIASALSLTSCSFFPELKDEQTGIQPSSEFSISSVAECTTESVYSVTEVETVSDTTVNFTTEPIIVSDDVQPPDASPAPPVSSETDFNNCKEQYISRIDTCLQTMQKTISSNLISTDNALSDNDPFWSAMDEKSSLIDVNPVEITSAVGILPSVSNFNTYESDFIPFVYEPVFGDTKKFSKLNPEQLLAVIAEKSFGVSSKSVNVGYFESQNLYCAYVISNKNQDYAVICALYAHVDDDRITQLGVETFTRAYSVTSDANGCLSSIYNISNIPTEDSFSDSYIVPEHKTMCDIAATVMSTGYYYQRSSAKFVSINDGSSYLDDCCHIRSVHYISWFYLT